MPRKRPVIPNGSVESNSAKMSSKSTISPPPTAFPQSKRKPSSRSTSGAKRKASSMSTEEPIQNLSSTVIEAPADREASPDEGESQNPDLDDGDQATQARQPAVNSDILPIPWKGRLGFACLNTILRDLKPPIFCSRTCRMDTIQGTAKKEGKGLNFAKDLGRQNAADLSRLLEWNERFGIRFMRLSSEMFPFASHAELGYTLEFAKPELSAAGRIAMKYGHRLTMHPGQFTQIASPKENVVTASIRDLEYHADLIDLLGLEGQTDRDAVMILHMGGMYGDKEATLARFKENYIKLSDRVKKRLVLENDDMCWSVEDLLPTCQQLGIPMVLDWHHNNVIPGSMREGTQDILQHIPAITALWRAKRITPKQHYSEPRNPTAIIRRDLRPHSKRVYQLPPCSPDMDLMIEAKDKEQAVFALRRKWDIEGGLPKEWYLTGEKMDEEREIPSEMGMKVFYEEGEEWRFKPPIKMPVRVSKMLEKLEKERGKVVEDPGELERLDEARRQIIEEWEREKRIKWGLEKKPEAETDNVRKGDIPLTPKVTPKRSSSGKRKKVVEEENEMDESAEWTPGSELPLKKTAPRQRRKTTEMDHELEPLGNGNQTNGIPMATKKKEVVKQDSLITKDVPLLDETKQVVRRVRSRKMGN